MDPKSPQTSSDDRMGITFNEIHSDEPHEAVVASKTEVAQKHTSTLTSHLSNKDEVFNVAKGLESGHIDAGTIVSDKKNSRPSFSENIRSAFSEWWGTTKHSLDNSTTKMQTPRAKKVEPVVSKVETRTDVVKSAAAHATFAPKDDHKAVIQKIRTFKQDVARVQNTPVVVKEASEKKSGWTHTDDAHLTAVKKIDPIETVPERKSETQPHMPPVVPVPNPQPKTVSHAPEHSFSKTPSPLPKKDETPATLKTSFSSQPVSSRYTTSTAPKQTGVNFKNTRHINVPDTVVKKSNPILKKNIWVAPRIQPESSVLAAHRTAPPVSQSYIPHQVHAAPQEPPAPAVQTATPTSNPVSPTPPVQKTAPDQHVLTPGVTSTDNTAPVQTFHEATASTESTQADSSSVPTPVSHKPSPFAITTEPKFSKPIHVPTPPVKNAETIEKKEPLPIPSIKPEPPRPLPEVSLVPQAPPPAPAEVPEAPHAHYVGPPRIVQTGLYKKTQSTSHAPATHTKTSLWSSSKQTPTSSETVPQQQFLKPLQRIPTPEPTETPRGYAAVAATSKTSPAPMMQPAEVPRSVPLPRQTPVEVPAMKPESVPIPKPPVDVPEPASSIAQKREVPAPPPSRPISIPPRARESHSEIPEQSQIAVPKNQTFRKFMKWAILICIALLGIALALFASIYFNVFQKDTVTKPDPIAIPTYLETTVQTPLVLTGTKEDFLNALTEKVSEAPSGLTQFYPTIHSGENARPGTSAEILEFLNAHLDQRTTRSLGQTLMIGSITTTQNEPFIMLQSTNFDVLFTGLIAWEPYLYTDFAPMFGTEVPTQITFTDAVRDNTSTRILYDNEGNEILLYSFINQNTVIITTSGEALSRLIAEF